MHTKTDYVVESSVARSHTIAMRCVWATVFAATAVFVSRAEAALKSYANRTDFDAAHPKLPMEDFEEIAVVDNGIAFVTSGLNRHTSFGAFSQGDILPGIEFSSTENAPFMSGFDLFAIGDNALQPRTNSIVLGQTYFDQSLNVHFDPSVNAVGLDVSVAGAGTTPTTVFASVFGASGPLGKFQLTVGLPDDATFFGFSSNVPIVSINLADVDAQDAEIIDNISFGTVFQTSVPEPSGLSIIVLAWLGLLSCQRKVRRT